MEKYETSSYLSVALNYDLARDWWDLSDEQHHFVYEFVLHDWDNFENWLAEHKQSFEDYKSGGKSRQKAIKSLPRTLSPFCLCTLAALAKRRAAK